MNEDHVEFDCEIINETPKAFKLKIMITSKKSKELWLPKSQVTVAGNKKGTNVVVPKWLAEKNELI